MTGFEDPFNRGTYPWGHEDQDLIAYVSKLGQLRKKLKALRQGDISYLAADGGLLAFSRTFGRESVIAASNRDSETRTLSLPFPAVDLLTGEKFGQEAKLPGGRACIFVPA